LPSAAPARLSLQLESATRPSSYEAEEYELYRRYQVAVHGDAPEKLSARSYRRFLCDSPLVAAAGHGSFHTAYRLRGVLVAVGVTDRVPSGLSSVYCFWEPALSHLRLGHYCALAEIAAVQSEAAGAPGDAAWLRPPAPAGLSPPLFYYLGLYIHSCPKMRYKAAFRPSQLLCPTTRLWLPFPAALPALEAPGRGLCLAPPPDAAAHAEAGQAAAAAAAETCPLLLVTRGGRGMVTLSQLPAAMARALRPGLVAWAQAAGPEVAGRAVMVTELAV